MTDRSTIVIAAEAALADLSDQAIARQLAHMALDRWLNDQAAREADPGGCWGDLSSACQLAMEAIDHGINPGA